MEPEELHVDALQMGVQLHASYKMVRNLHVDAFRDTLARQVNYAFVARFASKRIDAEEQVIQQALPWRQRIAVLFGKPIPVALRVELRRNCPHLDAAPFTSHVSFLAGRDFPRP